MSYKQVGNFRDLRRVAGDAGSRDPFARGGKSSMGYTKGEVERERLRSEIARIEETQRQKREQGFEVIAVQYNGTLEKLRKELESVK